MKVYLLGTVLLQLLNAQAQSAAFEGIDPGRTSIPTSTPSTPSKTSEPAPTPADSGSRAALPVPVGKSEGQAFDSGKDNNKRSKIKRKSKNRTHEVTETDPNSEECPSWCLSRHTIILKSKKSTKTAAFLARDSAAQVDDTDRALRRANGMSGFIWPTRKAHGMNVETSSRLHNPTAGKKDDNTSEWLSRYKKSGAKPTGDINSWKKCPMHCLKLPATTETTTSTSTKSTHTKFAHNKSAHNKSPHTKSAHTKSPHTKSPHTKSTHTKSTHTITSNPVATIERGQSTETRGSNVTINSLPPTDYTTTTSITISVHPDHSTSIINAGGPGAVPVERVPPVHPAPPTLINGNTPDMCPRVCDPFNPINNRCDITTSCTSTGGAFYMCACRASFRADYYNGYDSAHQIRVPGLPYVYVYEGVTCNTVCSEPTCSEVLEKAACV